MWSRTRAKTEPSSRPRSQAALIVRRDRCAALLALLCVIVLSVILLISRDTKFLMPGPLASAHSTIETCSACHTKSGDGKLTWMQGLVAGDRRSDSQACLTCHEMPATAFNAHGASNEVLDASTARLMKIATDGPTPHAARAQNLAFPTAGVVAQGLYCATCHQEHQGAKFDLKKMTEEQCRSCHVVKFDGFDGNHPPFEKYPLKRRTPIIYDHAGHFGKHFAEALKNNATKTAPATCATCHTGTKDRRIMDVAPFVQTCATCHQNQITGKDRVSGPKGIALLTLPGIDQTTLKESGISVGEWPDDSEAGLTPFMKLMISRNERGRAAVEAVGQLDLQDLSGANDAQLKAVAILIWEVKGLVHALIRGRASDVLADLRVGSEVKPGPALLADLTANMPRDLLVAAQRQWLPGLAREMANREGVSDTESGGWITTTAGLSGQLSAGAAGAEKPTRPVGATENAVGKSLTSAPESKTALGAFKGKAINVKAESGPAATAKGQPPSRSANQNDDLLFPTEEELRALKGRLKDAKPTPQLAGAGGTAGTPKPNNERAATADVSVPAAEPGAGTPPLPARDIESDVDPEAWAENGGWYRQDHALFYRPTGHKDKLIAAWLDLTGPQAPKGGATPAAAIFDMLTAKDAQGACTKCHSVDDVPGKGRRVNFAPSSLESKRGRFTEFIHEPHFGIMGNQGCLTCHKLESGRPYLATYERGDPQKSISNFGDVKKEQCQTCHTGSMARQDCLTCHKYHVNGVVTPIMQTKIPAQ